MTLVVRPTSNAISSEDMAAFKCIYEDVVAMRDKTKQFLDKAESAWT